jgi:hypothetical protein
MLSILSLIHDHKPYVIVYIYIYFKIKSILISLKAYVETMGWKIEEAQRVVWALSLPYWWIWMVIELVHNYVLHFYF